MIIPAKSKHAVIRFANTKGIPCIDEHLKVLHKHGYVWFGKLGAKLKVTIISDLLKNKSNYIILKSPKETYFCTFSEFTEQLPEDKVFPSYYTKVFETLDDFSIWFKITEIVPVTNNDILNKIVVISSRNRLSTVCHQSMSAHFFTTNLEDINLQSTLD